MVKGIEGLTEDERRALRGSKFAPLTSQPSLPPNRLQPRVAHPGGPVTTNKAAALAKFLERKLQKPGGLDSLNPDLIEVAVKNAKETVHASGTSVQGRKIRHISSFDDEDVEDSKPGPKKLKKKKKKLRNVGGDEDTSSGGSLKPERNKLKEKKKKKKKKKKNKHKNKNMKGAEVD